MSTARTAFKIAVLLLVGTVSSCSASFRPEGDSSSSPSVQSLLQRIKRIKLRTMTFREENIYRVVAALQREAQLSTEGATIPIALRLEIDEEAVDNLVETGHTTFAPSHHVEVGVLVTMFFVEEVSLDRALDALAEYCSLTWHVEKHGVVLEPRKSTPRQHPEYRDPFR